MDDVDPTGDRIWRGDDPRPITAKRVLAEDQSAEIFSDLRHEVALAARRHTEISTALDIYADELSHIAFAVAGDRSGVIEFDQIIDHVKAVVAERDELRSALTIAQTTLAFFASVIKAGEAWSQECEKALRVAMDGEDT